MAHATLFSIALSLTFFMNQFPNPSQSMPSGAAPRFDQVVERQYAQSRKTHQELLQKVKHQAQPAGR